MSLPTVSKPSVPVAKPVSRFAAVAARLVSKIPDIAVGIVLTAMFVAFVAATWAHLALLFDGSYYFIHLVSNQTPSLPYCRFSLALFHYPVILAAKLTQELAPIVAVFSGVFSCVSLASVILSWLVIRASKPGLIVWPVIAIGLTSIFAQPYLMSENLLACELAWPLLLGVLVPLTPLRILALSGLGLFLVFLHPVGVSFLAVAALAAIVRALKRPRERSDDIPTPHVTRVGRHNSILQLDREGKLLLGVAGALIAIVTLRLVIAANHLNNYETRSLAPESLVFAIRYLTAVFLAPGSALIGILSGLLLLVSSRVRTPIFAKITLAIAGILIFVSGGLALWWSSFFVLWTQSWFYLRLLFLLFMPIMAYAIVDSRSCPRLNISRSFISITCAIFFAASMCIQASVLSRNDAQLKADIAGSADTIVNMADYSWKSSAFAHWSITGYALILQGRKPEKIVVQGSRVAEIRKTGKVRISPWNTPLRNGFFQLPDLRKSSRLHELQSQSR